MSSSGEKPKTTGPTGRVRYEDSSVSGKTYVKEDERRSTISKSDLPFESSFMTKWFGSKRVSEKAPIHVEEQHAKIPVVDETGKRFFAHMFDVQYSAPGPGSAVAKGDGSTGFGSMSFMMAPGMKRGSGEFPVYSVPEKEMSRKQSDFSFFTPIPDPPRKK